MFWEISSTGKRGASVAEHLIEQGYAVLFLYRRDSVHPFSRHFAFNQNQSFLSSLDVNAEGELVVSPSQQKKLKQAFLAAREAKESHSLVSVSFYSLTEYLKYV